MSSNFAVHRYSTSVVTQGRHRFYTLSVPSDVLAECSFVSARYEDPEEGFQRVLDHERAELIAEYIDGGLGTIPTSVILSAQQEAELQVIGGGKTVQFTAHPRAFLVIDGQHRVYGFRLAQSKLRVPVVIYNNLTRVEEAKLFIDINTKQKPVPNELLLDIKKLAEYETSSERLFGEVFDLFDGNQASALYGLTSPIERKSGRLSRVTFNAALKPIFPSFQHATSDQVYEALNAYLSALKSLCEDHGVSRAIVNPTSFRAMMLLFPEVAQFVKLGTGRYSTDAFYGVLQPLFAKSRLGILRNPGKSVYELRDKLSKYLRESFTL